jgi:transcriptional regulator with XRE-family HTH domain
MSKENDGFDQKELLKRLGKHLEKLRASKGYSQDRLQLEAGLARGTLSKVERGLRDARASTLVKIAQTIGVPPKKIFDFKIPEND